MSNIIKILEDKIRSECKAIDVDASYDDMIDGCYSFSGIGGPFELMLPSSVLEEVDPIAYRCG